MAFFDVSPLATVSPDIQSPDRERTNIGANDGRKTHLYVIMHGIGRSFQNQSKLVIKIKAESEARGECADFWIPKLPWHDIARTLFGFGRLNHVIEGLSNDLDEIWANGCYDRITCVGYSLGGVTLRAMYLNAIDKQSASKGSASNAKRHWSTPCSEDRMVLLAAINRGAGASRIMGPFKALAYTLMSKFLTSIEWVAPHLVNSARRNAPFISQMRLAWVAEAERLAPLTVVQLLGSRDDLVGPHDTLDLITGHNFYYLDVPNTGHETILQVDPSQTESPEEKDIRDTRWEIISTAIFKCTEAIKKKEVRPWGMKRPDRDTAVPGTEPAGTPHRNAITDVVFVVHGIRDPGHWTDKIARRIWKLGGEHGIHFERVVDSYGYFGMGPFLFPSVRRQKVDWLVDRYIAARSKYPNARFHFVGHSHGTYLLAKMLELFPACRFDNIVFVGSVVRQGYDWASCVASREHRPAQVKRVLNFVATRDWVVAFFPRLFDFWNIQDLGGAGHLGFHNMDPEKQLYQVTYAVGGHSAAREENMWDAIANFVLNAPPDDLPEQLKNLPDGVTQQGPLETRRRGLWAHAICILSPVSILLCGAGLVVALALVPQLLVSHLAPWLTQYAVSVGAWVTGWTLLLVALLAGTVFAASQARYKRHSHWSIGAALSFLGAGLLAAFAWLAWSNFPPIEAFAGNAISVAEAAQASIATLLVGGWYLFLVYVLRKI